MDKAREDARRIVASLGDYSDDSDDDEEEIVPEQEEVEVASNRFGAGASADFHQSLDFNIGTQQPSTSSSVSLVAMQQDSQQDTRVIQRIAELRSAGLWSSTVMPKCMDPPRKKAHWDYLLEEIKWMRTDFFQERKTKRHNARKLAIEAKHVWKKKFERKEEQIKKLDSAKEAKRICGVISKMIRQFWTNADKMVDYKLKEIMNAKKRKALDQHLDQLVVEADKLTSRMYIQGQDRTSSGRSSARTRDDTMDYEENEDFSDPDDERTIEVEERRQNPQLLEVEQEQLRKEAQLDEDDFFASLPKGYLEQIAGGSGGAAIDLKNKADDTSQAAATEDTFMDVDGESAEVDTAGGVAAEEPTEQRLANVDYSKLKSVNSEERRQELNNIAEAALEFQPKGYTLATTQIKTEIPHLLNGTLREYQLVGLDWLVTLYEKNLNGILADEMGLGKTIQTIALLAHLACDRAIWGPHLIIVPTSVILNWEIELKKWCPSFKVLTYFGSAKERAEKRKGWSKENAFHVCITSYKIVTQDVRSFKMKAWQYMILDEAQNIKNFKSQRWQTLLNIRSRRRLLLTGTPLQNTLMELWSLLHFLMPSVFASHDDFREWFNNPLTSIVEGSSDVDSFESRALVSRLHKVLRPFILRRLKNQVEKQLPTKEEKIIHCALSKRQRFLYNEFLARKATVDNLQSGNMMSVLNIIMQLRKCCNHPNLFESRPVMSPLVSSSLRIRLPSILSEKVPQDSPSSIRLSNAFVSAAEWRLFDEISTSDRIKEMLDSGPEEVLHKIKGTFIFTNDRHFEGGTIILKEAEAKKEADKLARLSNSKKDLKNNKKRRSVTDGGKLIEVKEKDLMENGDKRRCIFRSAQLEEYRKQLAKRNLDVGLWLTAIRRLQGSPVISEENVAKAFNRSKIYPCLLNGVASSDQCDLFEQACDMISGGLMEWAERSLRGFSLFVESVLLSDVPIEFARVATYDKYQQLECDQYSRTLFDCVDETANRAHLSRLLQFPELRLIEYDCGKLQILSKLLLQLFDNKHRCLIFTQMSKMLDILQSFLSHHNYKYFRLDGSTPVDQRQAMMERFNSDDSIFCFILSTRSGGIGVNLTGADTVIFYDSDWNPTMDAQAQDRCHRIGQTRNVTIYRLISEKTIEENILKKAMQKRRLGEMAIDEAEFTPEFFRNTDNIRDLFSNEEGLAEIVAPVVASAAGNPEDVEAAMANVEDQQDVLDARKAQAEANVDVVEFDEERASRDVESPFDAYTALLQSLSDIEKYAVRFLEMHRPELEEENKDIKVGRVIQ